MAIFFYIINNNNARYKGREKLKLKSIFMGKYKYKMDLLYNLLIEPEWVLVRCKISHPDVRPRENAYKNLVGFAREFGGKKGYTSFIFNDYCVYYMAFMSNQFVKFKKHISGTPFIPNVEFEIVDPVNYKIYDNPNTPQKTIERTLNNFEQIAVMDYKRNTHNKFYDCHAFILGPNNP